ncbi:DUF4124 domain-containing protein [Pseudohaliea rubra]|uniref:DUF4124 domain-containing protein n=1 Tax=Pseudohaliea rubra DSM 19751 TaxID=1265313 RepID=A0A095VS04_9GAMM|nr:DUF4124 domain-containing protein [Pseudohaliea rubra]KGE04135.1 hypothetical protein HRUBRA_01267 [Pseudohaliea rubra DSM 19751]
MKRAVLATFLAPLALALAAGPGSAAATEYYKWRDERGQVVISDRPPVDPAIDYEYHGEHFGRTQARLFDDNAEPARGKVAGSYGPAQAPRSSPAGPSAKAPSKDLDEARCAAAKDRLFKLETFPRKRVEEDGEIRFMTTEEVEEQLRVNRELIQRHCPD